MGNSEYADFSLLRKVDPSAPGARNGHPPGLRAAREAPLAEQYGGDLAYVPGHRGNDWDDLAVDVPLGPVPHALSGVIFDWCMSHDFMMIVACGGREVVGVRGRPEALAAAGLHVPGQDDDEREA